MIEDGQIASSQNVISRMQYEYVEQEGEISLQPIRYWFDDVLV